MQEYAFIVPLIVIIWMFILAVQIGAFLDRHAAKNYPKPVEEKACPPHKWDWVEQPGLENTYFIRCKRCGKLPGIEET